MNYVKRVPTRIYVYVYACVCVCIIYKYIVQYSDSIILKTTRFLINKTYDFERICKPITNLRPCRNVHLSVEEIITRPIGCTPTLSIRIP